jgi:hypothetical protein
VLQYRLGYGSPSLVLATDSNYNGSSVTENGRMSLLFDASSDGVAVECLTPRLALIPGPINEEIGMGVLLVGNATSVKVEQISCAQISSLYATVHDEPGP